MTICYLVLMTICYLEYYNNLNFFFSSFLMMDLKKIFKLKMRKNDV